MASVERIPLTIHLPEVDDLEAIDVGELVAYMTELPGWTHIEAALDARVDSLKRELLYSPPRDNAAEYERAIGEMRGLESVRAIVDGLVKRAEEAKQRV